jgi:hypothetical protein
VDAHVHFHGLERVAATLNAAVGNFRSVTGTGSDLLGVLLLAQTGREQVFEVLQGGWRGGHWSISPLSDEPETVLARTGDTAIAIVCGRQVRTAEGLEVLALGTCRRFADGARLEDAFATVAESGALAVIPWGLGKMLGERGRRAARLLDADSPNRLFLGDNGSRLNMSGVPRFIRVGLERGFRVLPGTDPFPIAQDFRRVGTIGFLSRAALDPAHPWNSIRSWLVSRRDSPSHFGRACSLLHFVRIQSGIQVYNRLRRKEAA